MMDGRMSRQPRTHRDGVTTPSANVHKNFIADETACTLA